MDNKQTAYVLARIGLGIDISMHGLVRIPNMPLFTKGLHDAFALSILSPAVVVAFGTVLPFVELIIGLFILLGLFTRRALVAGAILMLLLLGGTCLLDNWQIAGLELGYIFFYTMLIFFVEQNSLSLDQLFKIQDL